MFTCTCICICVNTFSIHEVILCAQFLFLDQHTHRYVQGGQMVAIYDFFANLRFVFVTELWAPGRSLCSLMTGFATATLLFATFFFYPPLMYMMGIPQIHTYSYCLEIGLHETNKENCHHLMPIREQEGGMLCVSFIFERHGAPTTCAILCLHGSCSNCMQQPCSTSSFSSSSSSGSALGGHSCHLILGMC